MKKLNTDEFLKKVGQTDLNALSKISLDCVKEFKIGKNYYHSITKSSDFYRVNRNIAHNILERIPLNNASIAYRKGLSYFDLFKPHIGSRYFLRLDIKAFFSSIQLEDVKNSIFPILPDEHLKLPSGKKISLKDFFIMLVSTKSTKNGKIIPVGFSSSPYLANIIFRKIDIQIQEFCLQNSIIYTRYADDMLFSSQTESILHSDYFSTHISFTIAQLKMKLNTQKTLKTAGAISLNGYMIDSEGFFKFSNSRLKGIKKFVYLKNKSVLTDLEIMKKLFLKDLKNLKLSYPNKDAFIEKFCADQITNKAAGYRSFLISLLNFNRNTVCLETEHKKQIEDYIKKLNSILASD